MDGNCMVTSFDVLGSAHPIAMKTVGNAMAAVVGEVPDDGRLAELTRQGRGLVVVEQGLQELRVRVEDADRHPPRVGKAEPDVVCRGRLAGEESRRRAELDLVAGRAELVARLPGGGIRAGKEFLRGMDAVAATAREGESRQKGENPQLNSLLIRRLGGKARALPFLYSSNTVREFPAHPRGSQIKTPQEETRWKD